MGQYSWFTVYKTIIVGSDTIEDAKEKIQAAADEWRFVLDMKDYDECKIRQSLNFQE